MLMQGSNLESVGSNLKEVSLPKLTIDSTVIGIDLHKYSHTAVALNCLGEELSRLVFSNDELDECVEWLSGLGSKESLLVGLEDTNGHGLHTANRLEKEGFSLIYVPPVLTERARKHSVHKDKSDLLDAKRVGKVILHRSEETLPATPSIAQEKQIIREIDLLLQERSDLIKEQTRLKNQLHSLLHQCFGNNYRKGFKDIFSLKALAFYSASLKQQSEPSPLARSIVRRIERLKLVFGQVKEIDSALRKESRDVPSIGKLQSNLRGCGHLTACKAIAEIVQIGRFKTCHKLAKYSGAAPVIKGSGKSRRLHTNRHGNRKLNQAIHTIALSQIGIASLPEAQIYYQKKLSEGKSKLWALRCLKRQITNRIFNILTD